MLPQKYKFTAENAEGAEVTYLLQKGFSATSATSAVEKAFFATLSFLFASVDNLFHGKPVQPEDNGHAKHTDVLETAFDPRSPPVHDEQSKKAECQEFVRPGSPLPPGAPCPAENIDVSHPVAGGAIGEDLRPFRGVFGGKDAKAIIDEYKRGEDAEYGKGCEPYRFLSLPFHLGRPLSCDGRKMSRIRGLIPAKAGRCQ